MWAAASVLAPFPAGERRTVGLVSTAHSFSHFYMLLLPPIFPLLHADLGLSYAALGLLLSVYAVVTGVMQVPMGMLVDRVGGRTILTVGLALNALALLLVGLFPSYPAMLLFMAMAGAGNAVFHPADYAILSARVGEERMGRAFSMHLFAGYIGWMLAPPAMLGLTMVGGWRFARGALGLAGIAYAGVLVLKRHSLSDEDERQAAKAAAAETRANGGKTGFSLLMTPVIASLFLFYMIVAMAGNGIQSFSVVANVDLHGISLGDANLALTCYFIAAATGTLLGGWVADRVVRLELATAVAFALSAGFVALLGFGGLSLPAVISLMVLGGFFVAVVAPLRDIMVRQAAPKGSIGTAFGIVTTGFSAGFTVAPVALGWIVDMGYPAFIFWATAGITLLGVLTLGGVRFIRASREAESDQPLPTG
ncbi:MAG: MFS transporter [Ectothiorhodospiraceae bacterium]|nr:MFS transporter [Ectothiorhodospiraceae bacterium]